MSKFVITGASGYVASNLIHKLVGDGHEVVGLTRVSNHRPKKNKQGYTEITVGDYTDEALLARIVNGAKAVFHLAARAHQPSSSKNDISLFHAANVVPTEALSRACVAAEVGRLVLLSSIGVLGNRTDSTAFSDVSVPAPIDPYAVSKLNAEQRVTKLLAEQKCDYCILRPPLVYGPGSPGNFASLVGITANAPLVPLAGIRAPRTFIYINHLIDALLVAATHPAASKRTFVVSDGTDTSVAEITNIAAQIFGRDPWRMVAIPERILRALGLLIGHSEKFEKLLASLRVDCTGFQNATGWRPAKPASEAIAATLRQWPITSGKN